MTTSKTVQWIKCQGNVWCQLDNLNLQTVSGNGVYIIWSGTSTIYVGQGIIASRLAAHLNDPQIMRYNTPNKLMATWAIVPANQWDGIERYLADTLKPLVGTHHPNASPIPVNLPWG